MSERIRAFVAVSLGPELERALLDGARRLDRSLGRRLGVKWVGSRQIHITLQFLGDVDTGLLPKLSGGLRGAFKDLAPFEAHLFGLGAFPSTVRPRIIWAGVREGADLVRTLHALTLAVTEPLGFPREDRPFSPHVTLGRVKERGRVPDISGDLRAEEGFDFGKCQIDRVHLVRSELRPDGPVYTTVDSFLLGGYDTEQMNRERP